MRGGAGRWIARQLLRIDRPTRRRAWPARAGRRPREPPPDGSVHWRSPGRPSETSYSRYSTSCERLIATLSISAGFNRISPDPAFTPIQMYPSLSSTSVGTMPANGPLTVVSVVKRPFWRRLRPATELTQTEPFRSS